MKLRALVVFTLLAAWGCGKSETREKATPAAADSQAAASTDTTHSKLYPGKPFPSVDLIDLDENPVHAVDLVAGRASLVLFIDPDCEACREFLTVWKNQAGELPSGLNVVGITKADAPYAKQYKEESGFPFPLYCDDQGIFAREYRIKVYPTVVGTYEDGGVAFVGKAVTPEFTPKRAAALLAQAVAAKRQKEGR